MYRIIKVSDGTEIGVTDTIEFIRYGNSGCFVPADQKHAIGVAVNSVPYNLVGHDEIEGAETVVVSEISFFLHWGCKTNERKAKKHV